MKNIKSVDAKEYIKRKIGENIAMHEDTYWYFDNKFDDTLSRKYNKSIKGNNSVYATEMISIPRDEHHPFMSKTTPKGKDYVTWRYIYSMYKPYQKGKPIEKTDAVHQIIYKGKVIKQIVETGDCKKDAMILYMVKKLVYELLKQKFDDKKLYNDILERSKKACIPRYEDISGMNLFHKRMLE